MLVGAWFLIGELPRAIAAGDSDWWYGVLNTFYYSLGTIPVQLGIALLLAVLLFQEIRGKSLFRIVYFIPYIAPFVGTAAVFRIIFSSRPNAPMNSILETLGLPPSLWLNQPTGIFQLMLGDAVQLPQWAAGPSLALVVIIIYGTWTYIGFNTVIFMAGLGTIPRELHEAAAIDGAARWAQFRHITFALAFADHLFSHPLLGDRHLQGVQPHLRHAHCGRARHHRYSQHCHFPGLQA
ncbi:MAG: sugar ABC transporter permease [Caldilineaceae bacterium]|nr:sugar ABC transporter permease [Caldilineaceae bacterium]